MSQTPSRNRTEYYERIAPNHLTPLWEVMGSLITPEPKSACRAHLWRYSDCREALLEAGDIITAKEAERRVLILENPGLPGQSKVTTSLYAGLQLVNPGEVAPAHRHSQSALRFILEGSGAHTAVGGERTRMERGDFVITPNWAWHNHGNESPEPMIWLDGLDIPIVQFLDASFAERLGADEQPVARPEGYSNALFGEGLLPVDYKAGGLTSPVFNYRYEKARSSLRELASSAETDACHGIRLRYANPVDGGWAMPTMGTFLQLLPGGFTSNAYRSTDATVYVCVEGRGETRVGDKTLAWGPNDIFVVPSWQRLSHEVRDEAVLFSYSDRPVQEKLGLWREDRGNS